MIKNISSSFWVSLAAFLAVFCFATVTYANSFYRASSAQTSTAASNTLGATSTKTFMTPGAATSTTVYDSYEIFGTNQPNQGNVTVPAFINVLLDGVASSTSTNINATCEYSDNWNGSNGDWYQNEIFPATSTPQQSIGTPVSITFPGVTSSVGGATNGTLRFQKVFQCPVALRFVRAVISVTGANASMWTTIVPLKQRI